MMNYLLFVNSDLYVKINKQKKQANILEISSLSLLCE